MKFLLSSLTFFFLMLLSAARAQDVTPKTNRSEIEMLRDRIEMLEQNQQDLVFQTSDQSTKVNSFLKSNFTLGGFFEPSYTAFQGKDTPFQAASATNTLGLNFAAEYTARLKFVSQILTGITFPLQNPHNDPRNIAAPHRSFGNFFFGALLSQGYLDYDMNNGMGLQGGVGYSPFGYYAQQRELVLFVRRGGPQLLRTAELFTPLWSGFHFYKYYDQDSTRFGFNVYSFTRLEKADVPGLGARVWLENPNSRYTTGFSVQSAKYDGRIEETFGYDFKFQHKHFMLATEYAIHLRPEDDPWSAYIEPSFFVYKEEVLLYTFLDFAQHAANKTGTLPDPFQKFEYGGGVNWLPTSYTRLRAGVTINDYVKGNAVILGKNRDYVTLDISAGVAF